MNTTYMTNVKIDLYNDDSICPTSEYEWTPWNSMTKPTELDRNDNETLTKHREFNPRLFYSCYQHSKLLFSPSAFVKIQKKLMQE